MALRAPCRQLGKISLAPQALPPNSIAARSFFSTPAAQTNQVPPESPAYIPLPPEPFSDETKQERVRGSLPVPRKVFSHPKDEQKLRHKYLEQTYPRSPKEPARHKLVKGSSDEWKRIMAESRRKNLKLGLAGLWNRKTKTDAVDARFKKWRHDEFIAAGRAPVPDHEQFTKSSVLQGTLHTKVLPDPDRFEKAEASRRLTAAKEEERRTARRDAIMELYLNADGFIVDEKSLSDEIERLFDEKFWKKPGPPNAWANYGKRPNLSDMLVDMVRSGKSGEVEYSTADYARNVRRQKRVAEELTGGKMDTNSQ